jgi:hypothetical protein
MKPINGYPGGVFDRLYENLHELIVKQLYNEYTLGIGQTLNHLLYETIYRELNERERRYTGN